MFAFETVYKKGRFIVNELVVELTNLFRIDNS